MGLVSLAPAADTRSDYTWRVLALSRAGVDWSDSDWRGCKAHARGGPFAVVPLLTGYIRRYNHRQSSGATRAKNQIKLLQSSAIMG